MTENDNENENENDNESKEEAPAEPPFMTSRQSIEQVFNTLDPVTRKKVEEEVRVLQDDPVAFAQLLWAVLIWGNTQVRHLSFSHERCVTVINEQGKLLADLYSQVQGIRGVLHNMPEAAEAAARMKAAQDNAPKEGDN